MPTLSEKKKTEMPLCLLVAAQVASLLWTFLSAVGGALVLFPVCVARIALRRVVAVGRGTSIVDRNRNMVNVDKRRKRRKSDMTTWYKATVHHARNKPVSHRFSYDVRVAIVDLDDPPAWYDARTNDTMTADEAREAANTRGGVRLLTDPAVAGYVQNPISVYYCYDESGALETCIAEVTNTPWGERVTFLFDPSGTSVPKVLHVSPLMDMKNVWTLNTRDPKGCDRLYLRVSVNHAELGKYFDAVIEGQADKDAPHERNETASFGTLFRYGFQPQRVALYIYWHAVCLLYKGVSFYGPPGSTVCQSAAKNGGGCAFSWRPAQSWVWRERP